MCIHLRHDGPPGKHSSSVCASPLRRSNKPLGLLGSRGIAHPPRCHALFPANQQPHRAHVPNAICFLITTCYSTSTEIDNESKTVCKRVGETLRSLAYIVPNRTAPPPPHPLVRRHTCAPGRNKRHEICLPLKQTESDHTKGGIQMCHARYFWS